ncbi:MAG: hypothetical protein BJ554DRAFT_4730, partial [Olpidium bornovanus]
MRSACGRRIFARQCAPLRNGGGHALLRARSSVRRPCPPRPTHLPIGPTVKAVKGGRARFRQASFALGCARRGAPLPARAAAFSRRTRPGRDPRAFHRLPLQPRPPAASLSPPSNDVENWNGGRRVRPAIRPPTITSRLQRQRDGCAPCSASADVLARLRPSARALNASTERAMSLEARKSRFRPATLGADLSGLPENDLAAVRKLVEAVNCTYVKCVPKRFQTSWFDGFIALDLSIVTPNFAVAQAWSGNEKLYASLQKDKKRNAEVLEFYDMMKGPWDRIKENE